MNTDSTQFVVLAYAIGLGLLWGYAALLLWEARSLAKCRVPIEDKRDGGKS